MMQAMKSNSNASNKGGRRDDAASRPHLPLPRLTLLEVGTDETCAARAKAIAEKAWPPTYSDIIPAAQIPYMIERMYSPEAIREADAAGTPYYLVQADGADAGVCSIDLCPAADGSAELHKIYLLPEWWGRGIGAWLLAELCRRAKDAGATRVWLRVNKQNARAQKAYRAAGFSNVRALCTDIGGGFVMDDFIFERRLSSPAPSRS
jgi:GNAT superfamily N-acetyltransferase